MKSKWIPLMIERRRLKLSLGCAINHYLIVVFLLIPFCFTLYRYIKVYSLEGVISDEKLLFPLLFGLIGLMFISIQRNRLKFKTVTSNLSKKSIKDIIQKTATENEWSTTTINSNMIIAKTNSKWWTGSWGEQITIIINKSDILINSICDPEQRSSVVSIGRNKRNVDALIANIKNARR